MKFQSSLTHQLVRIAKYWYKLCTFDVYIYGGSSIIEILCVDAALDSDKEGKGTSFSILQAFRAFLQKVKVVDTLKIAFYPEKDKFIRLQAKDFSLPKYKSHFYHKILELKNFIIEPANPYNNLAPNIKEDTLKRLKKFAHEMLLRLAKLENTQSNEMKSLSPDGKDIALVHYDRLFEPFIMRLSCYPASAIPNKICVDYLYQNYDTAHVNAEVRPTAYAFFKEKKEAKFVYKTVMNNLLFLIRGKACRNLKKALSFTNGATDITKVQDVKDAVKLLIDANFGGKGMVTESSANKDHLDCYVTLSIPYRRMGKIYAVRFSMKWKN